MTQCVDINILIDTLEKRLKTLRGTWKRAVNEDALTMLKERKESIDKGYLTPGVPTGWKELNKFLLNNSPNWHDYVQDGNHLVTYHDIAHHYFTPSELVRYNKPGHDAYMAFNGETIYEMQERALAQATRLICCIANAVVSEP